MTAQATVVISGRTDPRLQRALKGATDQATKESRKLRAAQLKDATDAFHAKGKLTKQQMRVLTRAANEQEKLARRTARTRIREANKAARGEKRAAEKSANAQIAAAKKAQSNRRALIAGAAGAAFGAARGAAAAVGRGQSLAGVASLEQRLATGGDFRETLIRKSNEAGLTEEERTQLEERLLKASVDTNTSILDLVNGMAQAQTRFDKFKSFGENIGSIADAAAATGESVEDMVGVLGTATNVLQLDEKGQRDFLDLLVSTSQRGTIGVGDFSASLAPVLGSFAIATRKEGQSGIDVAREFFATAQVVGTSQAGAAETGTMVQRIIQELQKGDVQKKLKRIGVEVTEGGEVGGELKSLGVITQALATNEKFQSAITQADIFREVRGRKGLNFMIQAVQNDENAFSKLRDIEGGQGDAFVKKTLGDLKDDPTFKLRNLGAKAQAETIRDSDRIVKTITPAVEKMTDLQLQFPLLTESMDTLEGTVRWAVGAIAAQKFLGGTGAGAAIAGRGSAALAGASGVAAAGGAAGAATLAAGGLAAGAVGFFGTQALLEATGADKSIERFGASLFGDEGERAGPTSLAETAKLNAKEAAAKPVDLSAETIKALRQTSQIDVNLKSAGGVRSTRTFSEGAPVSVDVDAGMSTVQP